MDTTADTEYLWNEGRDLITDLECRGGDFFYYSYDLIVRITRTGQLIVRRSGSYFQQGGISQTPNQFDRDPGGSHQITSVYELWQACQLRAWDKAGKALSIYWRGASAEVTAILEKPVWKWTDNEVGIIAHHVFGQNFDD